MNTRLGIGCRVQCSFVNSCRVASEHWLCMSNRGGAELRVSMAGADCGGEPGTPGEHVGAVGADDGADQSQGLIQPPGGREVAEPVP